MGLTVAEQNYDAWGRERNPASWDYDMTGTFAKPTWLYHGYTGHEMLPEYGLINMNGRIYDPANGRMLRPDNYVQDPLNTQSYNRYSYCLNNPLKYMDPSGDQFEGTGSYGYSNNFVSSGYFNGLPYSFSYNSSYSYYSNSYTSSYNSGYGTTTYMNFVSGYSNSQSISANYAGFNASYSVNFGMNIQSSVVTGYQVNPEIAKLSSIGESISGSIQSNSWAAATIGFISTDIAVPDPSDAAWMKWAGYGLAGAAAYDVTHPRAVQDFTISMLTNSVDLVAKMNREIEGIKQRIGGPQGYQYALVANSSGDYPVMV